MIHVSPPAISKGVSGDISQSREDIVARERDFFIRGEGRIDSSGDVVRDRAGAGNDCVRAGDAERARAQGRRAVARRAGIGERAAGKSRPAGVGVGGVERDRARACDFDGRGTRVEGKDVCGRPAWRRKRYSRS